MGATPGGPCYTGNVSGRTCRWYSITQRLLSRHANKPYVPRACGFRHGFVEVSSVEKTRKRGNNMANDSQSRKWQITINNPVEKGFAHDRLKEILAGMKSVIYWCMADEIGENGTYHTHLYIQGRGGINFTTVKKRFDGGHFEMAKGTALQNKEYVSKTGKWEHDKKHETCVPNTFEEWGEMPVERQGARNDLADIYSMVKQGLSNYEIIEQVPDVMFQLDKLEVVRQTIRDEEFAERWRDLEVEYIYGDTGTGKTRTIMEMYGYRNVYRVTDYSHPFDGYMGQDVILFEEFRSSIKLGDMLKYLDGYPVVLPCRYANKQACFTKVYIVTNVPLSKQYTGSQVDCMEDYKAFLRRIHRVKHYTSKGIQESRIELTRDGFQSIIDGDYIPFEDSNIA